MTERPTFVTGRRTTIVPGREADYTRIHARIPSAVETALRESGVVRWQIWRDGNHLFHTIETVEGYDRMLQAIGELGPVDSEWDELIASLLDSEAGADAILPLVWAMDGTTQWAGMTVPAGPTR